MNHAPQYLDNEGHLREEGVAVYVDALRSGDLSSVPDNVRSHVEDCLACKKQVTGVFSFLSRQDASSSLAGKAATRRKADTSDSGKTFYRIAAVITALIGVGVIGYLLTSGYFSRPAMTAKTEPPAVHADSALKPDSTRSPEAHQFADAFRSSSELDELVGNELRSESVVVISPKNGIEVGARITFSWKEGGTNERNLSILNNKGEVVAKYRVKGESYVCKNTLPPGLYYWKLDDGSSLLYVGKFFVRTVQGTGR